MASIPKSKPEHKAKPASLKGTFSLVSPEKLIAIYAAMVKCRMVEQRAAILFQQGKLASDLHASSGREATAAAIAIDLQPNDSLSLSGGDWLPALVKGMTLEGLFRSLAPAGARPDGGASTSASELEQKNILLSSDEAPAAPAIRQRAIAAQAAKQGSLVTAILPSTEQSLKAWHKVLTAAASERLPIVFVHYGDATEAPDAAQPGRKGKNPTALFHGVPAIAVDALDAVAVYRVAYEAIVRAREGRGATLLECAIHAGNFGAGGAKKGVGTPLQTDSMSTMETYLKSKDIEPAPHNQQIVAAFNLELDHATRFLDA